jgi:sugar O-acyltransferase (sialic acid O-acetyltransferase NeuD family)
MNPINYFRIVLRIMGKLLKTVILGGGGHARDVLELISNQKGLDVIGILDDNWTNKQRFDSCPVSLLDGIQKNIKKAEAYVLGIGHPNVRRLILESIKEYAISPTPPLVHHTSVVSSQSKLGIGCTIFELSSVSPNVRIGDHCSISQHVTLGHDVELEENVCIFPGASISGNVTVGKDTMIGTNATILQGVSIGSNVKIGAGALVIKDVPNGVTMVGTPSHLHQ